jgi:hypothetical protein
VRVLMSEEADDDGASCGDGGECEGQGWDSAGESDGLEESCDCVTSCYASGMLSLADILTVATVLRLIIYLRR